jgi:parvulin-like peptidyl-prolyl isomerase
MEAGVKMERSWGQRVLREPLLHFALLGLGVFALQGWLAPAPNARTIVVAAHKQRELAVLFERRQGRAPSSAELAQLAQRFVEDEVLLQEAEQLGLSRQEGPARDAMLAQMRGLLQGVSDATPPAQSELLRYYAEHRADYALPERVSLYEHHFAFDSDAEDRARETLRALNAGEAVSAPRVEYGLSSEAELAQLRGVDWAKRVFAQAPGAWHTLRSGRGLHLVQLTQRAPAERLQFEAVRAQLESDYKSRTTQVRFAAELSRLCAGYDVHIEQATP